MKKLIFLTGTRADFGKLKALISAAFRAGQFEVHIFATGMHMNPKYGSTVDEIYKSGFKNIYRFINHDYIDHMDRTLAKTIDGFSSYVAQLEPDLIVVHGDRVEALAGAIVGSLNNIQVAHIEGGELSGTIDELIRHAVSKLASSHLVSNEESKKRLIQLGEQEHSIYVIGSPDLDLMDSDALPSLETALNYYQIPFSSYGVAIFHPITTELGMMRSHAEEFVAALVASAKNYIVIYPNNDIGSYEIIEEYKKYLVHNDRFRIFPSLRFEFFLVLLKNATFMIGNSSAGVREAPHYGIPSIDVGTRQSNRSTARSILHCDHDRKAMLEFISEVDVNRSRYAVDSAASFGDGKSAMKFIQILRNESFWLRSIQKQFQDIL